MTRSAPTPDERPDDARNMDTFFFSHELQKALPVSNARRAQAVSRPETAHRTADIGLRNMLALTRRHGGSISATSMAV
jgi:hypothetical protein